MSGKEDILLFGLGGVGELGSDVISGRLRLICLTVYYFAGSVYAYILNESPNAQVTVCARSNYKAVSEQGLDFQSEKYGNHPNYKFHNGGCDWCIRTVRRS